MATLPLSAVNIHYDHDLVAARKRARQIASVLGFDEQDQTRIATVTSEIARNALRYAKNGRVEFALDDSSSGALVICVTDQGPGIENLEDVLSGRYVSSSGMGIGITGARRLMDGFEIESDRKAGTRVVMKKRRPPEARRLGKNEVARIAGEISRQRGESPLEEMNHQNAELMRALSTLNDRQDELERLNRELEDTNRGVLALYAELDEKAESVRRADTLKTRFLSDMSHEFRTPVNSILALTRLLEEANLNAEPRKQLMLIRRAAEDLESLVSDLLDLAKIEAGKTEVRLAEFNVANVFSALRGMLRPLLINRSVALVFEDADDLPPLTSDEGKISQILRNFISNALKFTEAGEVRVSAATSADGTSITFSVADTGIGIAPADRSVIFQEFTQLDHPLQRRHKGTGLGLPLTRKLAELLGGEVGVESELGMGSRFWVTLPWNARMKAKDGGALRILIIDDDETARYTLRSFAARPGMEILEADNGLDGIALAQKSKPALILLDLMMPGIGGHEVLQRLKDDPATEAIPVLVVTSRFVNEDERSQILVRAREVIAKGDLSRELVTKAIDRAVLPRSTT